MFFRTLNGGNMRFFKFVLLCLLCVTQYNYAHEQPKKKASNSHINGQIKGNQRFALDLYNQLKDQKGNLLFSPYSISSALAMTSVGAKGKTKAEIDKAMHFHADSSKLAAFFGRLNSLLATPAAAPEWPQLKISNAFWMQVEVPYMPEYVETLEKDFKAGVFAHNFAENPEDARAEINQWVEGETQGRIKDLFPEGSITSRTRLVLANTIYMLAPWRKAFEPLQTTQEIFFVSENETVSADMMNTLDVFNLAINDDCAILELPYGLEKGMGPNLAMLIFLPHKKEGLKDIEKLLIDQNHKWAFPKEYRDVQVSIPKFKIENSFSLKQQLHQLGINEAFSSDADFSRITDQEPITIDDIVHKTFMNVDESGTEAAAATGITFRTTSMPIDPYQFVADHPFLFMVVDKKTGSILFMGRVVNP